MVSDIANNLSLVVHSLRSLVVLCWYVVRWLKSWIGYVKIWTASDIECLNSLKIFPVKLQNRMFFGLVIQEHSSFFYYLNKCLPEFIIPITFPYVISVDLRNKVQSLKSIKIRWWVSTENWIKWIIIQINFWQRGFDILKVLSDHLCMSQICIPRSICFPKVHIGFILSPSVNWLHFCSFIFNYWRRQKQSFSILPHQFYW